MSINNDLDKLSKDKWDELYKIHEEENIKNFNKVKSDVKKILDDNLGKEKFRHLLGNILGLTIYDCEVSYNPNNKNNNIYFYINFSGNDLLVNYIYEYLISYLQEKNIVINNDFIFKNDGLIDAIQLSLIDNSLKDIYNILNIEFREKDFAFIKDVFSHKKICEVAENIKEDFNLVFL